MASLMDASLGGGCDAPDPISMDCKQIFTTCSCVHIPPSHLRQQFKNEMGPVGSVPCKAETPPKKEVPST